MSLTMSGVSAPSWPPDALTARTAASRERPITPTPGRPDRPTCVPIAGGRSAWHQFEMTITPAILAQLPLRDVRSVVFFKRDEITTDLICCEVEVSGRVWMFHEEALGWSNLIAHLSALPGFSIDWYEAVVSPSFGTAETIAFDRRHNL